MRNTEAKFSQISILKYNFSKKTLRVVTIAMICANLASLWKFHYFLGLYIAQSNIYDGAFIAKM